MKRGKGHFRRSKGFPPLSNKFFFSIPLAGLCVSYEFYAGLDIFLSLYDTCSRSFEATARICFFFLQAKIKSNYFLWALSSGTSLSCSERHSCCSWVFSFLICFLIFSLSLSLSHIKTPKRKCVQQTWLITSLLTKKGCDQFQWKEKRRHDFLENEIFASQDSSLHKNCFCDSELFKMSVCCFFQLMLISAVLFLFDFISPLIVLFSSPILLFILSFFLTSPRLFLE